MVLDIDLYNLKRGFERANELLDLGREHWVLVPAPRASRADAGAGDRPA
jgi:hypothetical protein